MGVLIFIALTAYDTQRIGRMAATISPAGDAAAKSVANRSFQRLAYTALSVPALLE